MATHRSLGAPAFSSTPERCSYMVCTAFFAPRYTAASKRTDSSSFHFRSPRAVTSSTRTRAISKIRQLFRTRHAAAQLNAQPIIHHACSRFRYSRKSQIVSIDSMIDSISPYTKVV